RVDRVHGSDLQARGGRAGHAFSSHAPARVTVLPVGNRPVVLTQYQTTHPSGSRRPCAARDWPAVFTAVPVSGTEADGRSAAATRPMRRSPSTFGSGFTGPPARPTLRLVHRLTPSRVSLDAGRTSQSLPSVATSVPASTTRAGDSTTQSTDDPTKSRRLTVPPRVARSPSAA